MHCISVLRNGQLVAASNGGLAVRPSLEKAVDAPGSILDLTFTSTAATRPMIFAIGTPSMPIPLPGFLYTLQVVPLVTAGFVTNGASQFVLPINLGPLPAGLSVVFQGLQWDALPYRFTNPITLTVR